MVTIDCADATELATFYSRLLGMTIAYQDDNVAMITGESGPALGFGTVDHYTRRRGRTRRARSSSTST